MVKKKGRKKLRMFYQCFNYNFNSSFEYYMPPCDILCTRVSIWARFRVYRKSTKHDFAELATRKLSR